MIDISFVIPVYFNEGSLEKTFLKLKDEVFTVFPKLTFEVIFINDGSSDGSQGELDRIKDQFPEVVTVIELTRNFGQVAAIYAGYNVAKGDGIMNIAADLQEPVELLISIIESFLKEDAPIVIGQRIERDESAYRKITSDISYSIMRNLSFSKMPKGGFDIALITSDVRDILLSLNESNPFWQGQLLWTGFPMKIIPYERKARFIGKSRWTFSKKIKYLLDGILNYSYAPLRFFSLLGLLSFILGIIYSVLIVILYCFFKTPFNGWAPIMIIILLFSGLQLVMLGLIGEYLWRTLEQAKNKPKFIIKNTSANRK